MSTAGRSNFGSNLLFAIIFSVNLLNHWCELLHWLYFVLLYFFLKTPQGEIKMYDVSDKFVSQNSTISQLGKTVQLLPLFDLSIV